MTQTDQFIGALCAWRENRGGGTQGMQSVFNVLMNRAKKDGTTIAFEAERRLQFSSMTAQGDPNLLIYPEDGDPQFAQALDLATEAAAGTLSDLTFGATSYYAESMKTPPYWAASIQMTVAIAGQVFYR